MIRRILVAFGGVRANPGSNFWAASVAQGTNGSVTVIPLMDAGSWMRQMPSAITSGHAARVLEHHPWDVVPEGFEELRKQCESVYGTTSVPWELVDASDAPWNCVVRESQFHDLVILGLDDAYDPVIVPSFFEAIGMLLGAGTCPILCVPPVLQEVRKVLILFSGTAASARALKRYVHSHLWVDAPIEVVCQSERAAEAESHLRQARQFLGAHGRTPSVTALQGHARDLCRYALESTADLIVAGSSHRNRLGIETTSEVLRGLLAQNTVPVFLASS